MPETSPTTPQNALPNAQLSVLVVDPNPGIRANLQNMLNGAGITRVEFAVNAGTAVKQLARRSFDVILCEYDLGGANAASPGQDGQQLLEDLRRERIIPPWAIFIMLTAEGSRDRVVSAAELAPTDYVLKPFTAGMLHERITRALARRAALLPAYHLVAQGQPRAAIQACIDGARARPRFAFDFARLRAELHASLREPREAERVYREVLAARPLGWAGLGLARAMVEQERIDEAATLLDALIDDNPRLMAAYDLLARCHEARADHAGAQKVLAAAVAISPHMVGRLRRLGEVALDAGDPAAAEQSYRQAVARSRHSAFRTPQDHLGLVKALVAKGDAPAAGGVIRDMERSLQGAPETAACAALASALVQDAGGNGAGAVAQLKQAVDAVRGGSVLSSGVRVDLARACLAHKLDDEAAAVMMAELGTATPQDAGVSARQATEVFVDAGRPDLAEGMVRQLRAQAQILLGIADEKRNMGDVRGAVQTLLEALNMAPNNLQVMIALVGGILRQVMEMGWDEALGTLCGEQLAHIRGLDASHPRLAALEAEFAAAKRKYGISS
jgi:CheY-like chemotaxis protein/predicted negative regulator of RcsB-dependent stress response